MAHEIEQFSDGTAAFVSARESAWHRLGTVTTDALTAEDAMRLAALDGWNVRLIGLHATEMTAEGTTLLDVPNHRASVRTHPRPACRRRWAWSAPTTCPCRTRNTPSS